MERFVCFKENKHQYRERIALFIRKAQIPGPYILVGHSFGGSNMLVFTDLYPKETVAVILVDSVHEDLLKEQPTISQSFIDKCMSHSSIQWLLNISGYQRLKGPSVQIKQMFLPLSEEIRDSYIAQMNKPNYTHTVSQEMNCLEESLSQLCTCNLQNKPLVVISADLNSNIEEGKIWSNLQKKLLSKSKRSKQIIAKNSDHMINHHEPGIIVEAIREVVNSYTSEKR